MRQSISGLGYRTCLETTSKIRPLQGAFFALYFGPVGGHWWTMARQPVKYEVHVLIGQCPMGRALKPKG